MSNEPFGRQLRPIRIQFEGGEQIDRDHWRQLIIRFLSGRACTFETDHTMYSETLRIYPDANND